MRIGLLPKLVESLPTRERRLFKRIFHVEKVEGRLKLPLDLKFWAEKTFGSLERVEAQSVIKVVNNVTLEAAFFNELRSLRPVEAVSPPPELLKAEGCFFCQAERLTAENPFGRLRGKHGVTAANIAMYDGWHGLAIFTRHNPLAYRREEVLDVFTLAIKWFRQVRRADRSVRFPFILWNCLWRAGASIIHGHLQMVASREAYPKVEHFRRCASKYKAKYASNYFEDFYHAHEMLGLGFQHGEVKVMASLTPLKEREIVLLSPRAGGSLLEAVYRLLKVYRKLKVSSFNLSMALPPLERVEGWEDFPVLTRMVDRGNLEERTSDVGGMELYAASIVSSDPFQLAEALKEAFKRK